MKNNRLLLVSLGLAATSVAFSQTLFSDAGESMANYTRVNLASDNDAYVVDYSNFTVDGVNHSIAEAPRQIAGSASTSGILMRANFDSTTGVDGVNLILGATPLNITAAQYTLSFDMYLGIPEVDFTGSTHQGVWGVGRANSTDYIGRPTRTANGSGTWGWAAGDGGYGTEDYSAYINTTNFGTQRNVDALAQSAFPNTDITGAPGDSWATVDIVVNNGNTKVYYNNVLFFDMDNSVTSGYAMVGYEDPFSSISVENGELWGLIDNVTVEAVPEPATMSILALGALAALRKRKQK